VYGMDPSECSPRLRDKTRTPNEEEIKRFLGTQASEAWSEIRQFIESRYDFTSETAFYGVKHGWTVRYRKSGKTLCSLFPEKGQFSVLIVLGKKESEKALSIHDELTPQINNVLRSTEQLHDGRWLWIRVANTEDINGVKRLLLVKRKPKNI
jgi:hypothetical protein